MELLEAVQVLSFIVESDTEKAALKTLTTLARNGQDGERASSKQMYFLGLMADASDVDLKEEAVGLGLSVRDDNTMSKTDAMKLIKEFKRRGYDKNLEQR